MPEKKTSEEAVFKKKFERRTMTLEEWHALGEKLYGEDVHKWRFKCVSCGHVQTLDDFLAAGLGIKEASTVFFFSCLGRWKDGVGCDWTLGGLFQLHRLEVINEDGKPTPVFEFADELPAEEGDSHAAGR